MPVKPAKNEFNEEEILEILRKNISIYKDEDGFVEYFATLAAYLYGSSRRGGEQFADLDFDPLPGPKIPRPVLVNGEVGGELPPTAAQRREAEMNPGSGRFMAPSPFRGTSPVPPPPSMPDHETPLPFPGGAPAAAEIPPAPSRTSVSGVFQVTAASLVTPPEEMPRASADAPRFIVPKSKPLDDPSSRRSSGTSRVYRVARSYKSQSAQEVPCKVCGTRVPIESKQCPICGSIMA